MHTHSEQTNQQAASRPAAQPAQQPSPPSSPASAARTAIEPPSVPRPTLAAYAALPPNAVDHSATAIRPTCNTAHSRGEEWGGEGTSGGPLGE